MLDKKENLKIFLGYAIMSLQKLGYSENSIKNFIKEMENVIKFISDAEATDTIDKFLDDSTKQVVFDEIKIPTEYNMWTIAEFFEKVNSNDKKHKSYMNRLYFSLKNVNIIYIKDLYNKTPEEIKNIKHIGSQSYDFFIKTLKKIVYSL